MLRSECTSRNETDDSGKQLPLPAKDTSDSPTPVPRESKPQEANGSFVAQELSFGTDSYQLSVVAAKKVVDTITLVLEVSGRIDETVVFGLDWAPYLLDQNGERWDYEDDTSDLVKAIKPSVKLPPEASVRTQIRFEATGANTGTSFTLMASEQGPKHGRPIVINGIRVK